MAGSKIHEVRVVLILAADEDRMAPWNWRAERGKAFLLAGKMTCTVSHWTEHSHKALHFAPERRKCNPFSHSESVS